MPNLQVETPQTGQVDGASDAAKALRTKRNAIFGASCAAVNGTGVPARSHIEQFAAAMAAHGLQPSEVVDDSKLHRFDGPDEKRGKRSAWYCLHGDGLPAGSFGYWRTGLSETWCAKADHTMTEAERLANRQRIERAKAEAAAERAKVAAKAAAGCIKQWDSAAEPDSVHEYVQKKGIKPFGAKQSGDDLLVPLRDVDGKLHSIQTIKPDGTKLFKSGGTVVGCYCAIGGDPAPDTPLLVCEGWATACSLHEATGHPVAAAMNAGNLLAVAQALRAKLPNVPMIICADDDYRTDGNPGLTKGTEAAKTIGAQLAVPDFGPERPDGATDFNDLHVACDTSAVLSCIAAAQIDAAQEVAPDAHSAEPDVGVEAQAGSQKTTAKRNRAVASGKILDKQDHAGGRFEVREGGVYFVGTDSEGKEKAPQFLCTQLQVVAKTRDAKSGAWGRLLRWRDADKVQHQWAMPVSLLQGDGADVRRELASLGLEIAPSKSARDLLSVYLQCWKVGARARCVERLGWHGPVYVLADESIGRGEEIVVFQNEHALEPALSELGTVDQWISGVAALVIGNSRLVFSIATAFAGPLASLANIESGGFHLRGGSSTGKSTGQVAACSVWGDPQAYKRTWRATTNGLEGLAALHNDGTLVLDEISQIDAREIGEAAYMLANGQGKARASRTGAAKQAFRWRLLFLSSGEESLATIMNRAGKRPNAGQEIRLADIEADAGAGMGAVESLNGYATPAALTQAISDNAHRFHGAVGMAWIRKLAADRAGLPDFIKNGVEQFVIEAVPQGADSQVQRVAKRFALVAIAGEIASHYGLTGWQGGESTKAAKACFVSWLESFGGTGNREERAMLEQVLAFFGAHGSSRFEDVNTTHEQRIVNRAGFHKVAEDGSRTYYVLPEAFKREVCQGFDVKTVTAALRKAGWLAPGEGSRATQKPRLPGLGPTRCYVLTGRMWESE